MRRFAIVIFIIMILALNGCSGDMTESKDKQDSNTQEKVQLSFEQTADHIEDATNYIDSDITPALDIYWSYHDEADNITIPIEEIDDIEKQWERISSKTDSIFSFFDSHIPAQGFEKTWDSLKEVYDFYKKGADYLKNIDLNNDGNYTEDELGECATSASICFGFNEDRLERFKQNYKVECESSLLYQNYFEEKYGSDIKNGEQSVNQYSENNNGNSESNVPETQNTEKPATPSPPVQQTHKCIVDGCNKTSSHTITGLNGTEEYYCGKHYQEMLDNINRITKSCMASGCNNPGTHSIVGLNGTEEYYCDKHYQEMIDIMNEIMGN